MNSLVEKAARVVCDRRAQASVEYAVVLGAVMIAVVAGSLFWHALDRGILAEHAVQAASHHVAGGQAGAMVDVFSY